MNQRPDTAIFDIPGGLTVDVPNNSRLMTPFILAEQGDWFEAEIHFIRRWLKPGMAVVDVGANYGLYTLTCADLVGPQGKLWAYEPASLPRSFLTRSLVRNKLGHVQLIGKAMSDHQGSARLGIAGNAELNSLGEIGQAGETVELTTLDCESAAWDRPIDFLKLDAEGEEVRILSAARQFFAKHGPLVMFEYKHGSVVNQGLVQAIAGLGMALYRHVPSLNVLVPMSNAKSVDPFLLNVFGCYPERAQHLAEQGLLVKSPATLAVVDVAAAESRLDDWNRRRPWRSCLWPSDPPKSRRPGTECYLAALADLLSSDDASLSAPERLAYTQRGFANILLSIGSECNISRLLSAARAAMDAGERGASVFLLGEVQKQLLADNVDMAAMLPEPFLPPDHRHDNLEPKACSGLDVLSIMVDEPLLERSAFSIYFAGENALPTLQRVARNPLCSPRSERRLAVAKALFPTAGSICSPPDQRGP